MTMVTVQKIESLEIGCKKLLERKKIRHVAVINHLGMQIAGRFKPGVIHFLDEEKIKMVYVQLLLDFKMRQKLDDLSSPVDYIASKRKSLTIICVPTTNYLIVISADRNIRVGKAVKRIKSLFDVIDLTNQ
ncbi:MAG: hypothetical protein OES14_06815 [Nitrosopumilus sp.]|nr:hypothetical protein [Nitrosopumilus sp.]MDH3825488.1 hypothetical protein [Nitrosopumilus sp.]